MMEIQEEGLEITLRLLDSSSSHSYGEEDSYTVGFSMECGADNLIAFLGYLADAYNQNAIAVNFGHERD